LSSVMEELGDQGLERRRGRGRRGLAHSARSCKARSQVGLKQFVARDNTNPPSSEPIKTVSVSFRQLLTDTLVQAPLVQDHDDWYRQQRRAAPLLNECTMADLVRLAETRR
jgi:hypothetical protein